MYLKRLEIHGFKTFATPTEVEFVPGFMAVVGPNGSGKSNLTDAIRYCLGEQSAKVLRAGKQDELVFAGTPSRKPSACAEVTAVFDNSDGHIPIDFAEVAITRKTSRDGDSQYYINRTACRLRDVHELLMGSGVGPGSFSVLGGKEVDMVLSSDPKDRRLMIEETAGTNRYRFRKKEAARKLEQTSNNVLRLRDILQEVEKSVLDSQQALARYEKYKKAQDELSQLDGCVALTDWQRTQSRAEESQALLTQSEVASTQADARENELSHKVEAQENARGEQQIERDELQATISNTRSALSSAQASLGGLHKRAQQLEISTQAASQRLQNSSARIHEREDELKRMETELPLFQANLERAEKVWQALKNELKSYPPLPTLGGDIKEQIATLERQHNQMEAKLESLKARSEQENTRRQEILAEAETLRQEMGEPFDSTTLEEARDQAAAALASEHGILQAKEEASRSLLASRSRRSETEKRRRPLATKVMELESILEDHVGLPPAVRCVINWREPGTIGVIGDLIKVREGVETAMEAALGGRLHDVVTSDRHTASALIERLRRERAGRVTFWPLDLSRRESDPMPLPTQNGVVGQALSLIEYDPQLRPVLKQMLGQTVVMRDLPSALALYDRCTGRRPTLVTLQGEYLSPSGAVTGGATKTERTGTLARRRNLEEARRNLRHVEEELADLAKSEEEASLRLQTAEEQLSKARETSRTARQVVADLESEQHRQNREIELSQKKASKLDEEAARLAQHALTMERERTETLTNLGNNQREAEALRLSLSRTQEEETRLRVEQETLRRRAMQAEIEYNGHNSALQEKQRELERLKGRFSELQDDNASASRDIEAGQVAQRLLEEESSSLQETIAQLTEQLKGEEKRLAVLVSQSQGYDEALRELRAEHARAAKKARECGEELRRRQVEHRSLQTSLEQARTRWEETGLTQSAARLLQPAELDKARSHSRRLRSFLENFGSVNLGAREDFERLSARQVELREQINDLDEASDSLKTIMAEMDRASIARFQTVFARVNETFSRLFKEIFAGGWAKLELCDPDDPLESGVEIVACPPGKKLQNLLLFSSGERALSAIAFLLALLSHKPSPIVVLDELDAPLDDSNVEKIAVRLQEFSASSQFLVITHNRKTMEFANRLYGVTMEEPGVSRLLSVELRDITPEGTPSPRITIPANN